MNDTIMKELLKNPIVFAIATSLVAGAITYFYARTVDPDPQSVNKSTFKVIVVVFAVNAAAMWFLTRKTVEDISTEPFRSSS
jgi:hypothetical protein